MRIALTGKARHAGITCSYPYRQVTDFTRLSLTIRILSWA